MRIGHLTKRLVSGDVTYLRYLAWQRWHALDFSFARATDLGMADRGHDHLPSGGPDLVRALAQLDIPAGSRIVDLGSGKGAAAFTLAGIFSAVLGVELSPVLLAIAEQNLAKLRLANVRFIFGDAAEYTNYDDASHVYMFNAFPVPVLASVVAHIRNSLIRRPRQFTVILKFPGSPPNLFAGFRHAIIHVPLSHPFHVFVANGEDCASEPAKSDPWRRGPISGVEL